MKMSDYYFVIEELDTGEQNGEIKPIKDAAVLDSTTANVVINSEANSNFQSTELATEIDPLEIQRNDTLLPRTRNIMVTGRTAIETNAAAAAQLSSFSSSSVLGIKFVYDLTKLDDDPEAQSKEEFKIWPQYRWDCFLCAFRTTHYNGLIIHLNNFHNITSEDDVRYKCYDCGLVIDEYSQFLNHIRQIHHAPLKLLCDVCNRDYQRYENLAKHRRSSHQNNCMRPMVFNCFECELAFATKEDLKDHEKQHIWSCNAKTANLVECSAKYKSKDDLITHLRKHLSSEQFKNSAICEVCALIFPSYKSFWVHLATHPNDLPFKCVKCEARFKTKSECIHHLQFHKIFPCKHCPHVSNSSSQLEVHKASHESARNSNSVYIKCLTCGRKFNNKSALKNSKLECLRCSYNKKPRKNSK